jgi:ADP-dependent NAD(P)H-hydrate dehydratase
MSALAPIDDLLRDHPLPRVGGDKEARGSLVLVAGSEGCPGAAQLAATSAFRSGAGRVQIVTASAVAVALAVAVPEVLVAAWAGTGPVPPDVRTLLERADAVCIGPGLDRDAAELALAAGAHVAPDVPLLLDARAIPAVTTLQREQRCVLVPNESEARRLVDLAEDAPPVELARALSDLTGEAVAVRGEHTVVAVGERVWESPGSPGLGTAGSGDVLAGLAGGLLARGVEAVAAVGWAVAIHARAGERLGAGRANPGYLARELVDVVPDVMEQLRT